MRFRLHSWLRSWLFLGASSWTFTTNGKVTSRLTALNGAVYFGSHDHSVYAVNATTGKLIWEFATNEQIDSAPVLLEGSGGDPDVVYILVERFDIEPFPDFSAK